MTNLINTPGVYRDLPFDDYVRIDALNASLLKEIARCPAAAWWHMNYPREQTTAMKLGKARHGALLEPSTFEDHFVVADGCGAEIKTGTRAGQLCGNAARVCRAGTWYCGTHDPAKGEPSEDTREPLSEDEMRDCLYVRDAVLAHPVTRPIVTAPHAMREVTLVWREPDCDLLFKARVDLLDPDAAILFDLKTTGLSSRPQAVRHAARRYGWHLQAAHYIAGGLALADELNIDLDVSGPLLFIFGAIESTPPNVLTPIAMSDEAVDVGMAARRAAIQRYIECMDTDEWPGYATGLEFIEADDVITQEANDENE